jgi:hypothetical protein
MSENEQGSLHSNAGSGKSIYAHLVKPSTGKVTRRNGIRFTGAMHKNCFDEADA